MTKRVLDIPKSREQSSDTRHRAGRLDFAAASSVLHLAVGGVVLVKAAMVVVGAPARTAVAALEPPFFRVGVGDAANRYDPDQKNKWMFCPTHVYAIKECTLSPKKKYKGLVQVHDGMIGILKSTSLI